MRKSAGPMMLIGGLFTLTVGLGFAATLAYLEHKAAEERATRPS